MKRVYSEYQSYLVPMFHKLSHELFRLQTGSFSFSFFVVGAGGRTALTQLTRPWTRTSTRVSSLRLTSELWWPDGRISTHDLQMSGQDGLLMKERKRRERVSSNRQ